MDTAGKTYMCMRVWMGFTDWRIMAIFQYLLENNKQKNYWLENNEGLKYKE